MLRFGWMDDDEDGLHTSDIPTSLLSALMPCLRITLDEVRFWLA